MTWISVMIGYWYGSHEWVVLFSYYICLCLLSSWSVCHTHVLNLVSLNNVTCHMIWGGLYSIHFVPVSLQMYIVEKYCQNYRLTSKFNSHGYFISKKQHFINQFDDVVHVCLVLIRGLNGTFHTELCCSALSKSMSQIKFMKIYKSSNTIPSELSVNSKISRTGSNWTDFYHCVSKFLTQHLSGSS